MTRLVWFLRGYWVVEIRGASPDWVLNRLTELRIPFWDLQWLDALTVRVCIFRRDLSLVREAAERSMCQMSDAVRMGLRPALQGVFRPVLLVVILLTGSMALTVPRFLLFFEVTGNETVPEQVILRALEDLDIGVGIYGPKVKPKWIKDHVLNVLPQLQWITVTQNGCMAQVVVRERPETPHVVDRKGFANVIATRSGLITSQSVLAGQPLKQVGDVVTEGELLVSGVVNLERVFTIEYAQAEIFARTWRETTVVTPAQVVEKYPTGDRSVSLWLEFGKERIKIFGNSGISTAACDKMIDRKILSLPGGLQLPVAMLIETCEAYETEKADLDQTLAGERLFSFVELEAAAHMQAGEILQRSGRVFEDNGLFVLSATLECREMIAETVEAKWNEEDFADD